MRRTRTKLRAIALAGLVMIFLAPSLAMSAESPGERGKTLDFDNEVIEGMNKNPYDSLTATGRKEDRKPAHLYHRKENFKREIRQTVKEMGYTQ